MSNIRKEFRVHRLNEGGLKKCEELAVAFSSTLDLIDALAPLPSREKSVAITNLEQASAWAKRALAQNPENWLEDKA
jgi:hypothetical protein